MFRKGDPAIIRSTGQKVVIEGPGEGRQLVCRLPRRFVKLTNMPEPGWGYAGSGCPMNGTIAEVITYRRPPRAEDAASRETVALWGNRQGTIWVHRRTTDDSYGTIDEDAAAGRIPIVFHLLKSSLEPVEAPDYLAWPDGVYYDEYGDEMEADPERPQFESGSGRPRYETISVDEADLQMAHPTVLASIEAVEIDPLEAFRKRRKTNLIADEAKAADVQDVLDAVESYDLNGHWRGQLTPELKAGIFEDRLLTYNRVSAEGVVVLKDGNPDGRWVSLGVVLGRSNGCPWCGKDDLTLETNGKVTRIAGERCKYADGVPPVEFELNIPSGRMVVADDGDLRPWFPVRGRDSDRGLDEVVQGILRAANHGLAQARVGQCSPVLYWTGPGRFAVVQVPRDERWDPEAKQWVEFDAPKPEGKKVTCCGEFGYTICDGDEFDRRIARFGGGTPDVTVIAVPPGVYRFRHHVGARFSDSEDKVVTFAEIERVRDPDPVRDFLGEFDAATVTAGQYVQTQVLRWPSLFGAEVDYWARIYKAWGEMSDEERLSSWQRVADHTLCVIGGGTEWHPNGFPLDVDDDAIPDAPVPKFRQQHSWYPMSENYGGLCLAAGVGTNDIREWEHPTRLAPSFARLAFEVCESMVSFGVAPRDDNKSRGVKEARRIMRLALRCYRALAEKYPEQADPAYLTWVRDGDRADQWVETFDLGPSRTRKHQVHADRQRWFPADAYAVEFDARKLADGYFAHHPTSPGGGTWAHKASATRFAIEQWKDNGQEGEDNCFWSVHAANSVPLYTVARVTRTGIVSHMGDTLVEVAFDYGTPWMRDPEVRKALIEQKWSAAIRPLTKEEYEALLPTAEAFFEESERTVERR